MAKTNTREPLTEVIPVTNMVEVPVLTEEERAEFMESIREAEADFREGRFKVFTAEEFAAWITQRGQEIRAKKRAHGV
jgi:hypothetical protein